MTAPLGPQTPVVNLGNLYMNGLKLSWLSTTSLNVSPGQCRDSTDTNDIQLPASITYGPSNARVTITPTYTISTTKSGALGVDVLPTAGVAASTLYYVYAIGSSTNNSPNQSGFDVNLLPSALISLSATAPTLPYGYDMFRRIGAVRTDATAAPSHLVAFFQTSNANSSNRTMNYVVDGTTALKVVSAGASTSYAQVVLTSMVPATATNVKVRAVLTPNTAGNLVALEPTKNLSGLESALGYAAMSGDVSAVATTGMLTCPMGVDASVANIYYKVSNGSDAVDLYLQGYEDEL